MTRLFSAIALIVFIASACSTQKTLTPAVFEPLQPDDPFTVTIETSPCFGTCPEYTLEIDHKGVLRYQGKANVALIGSAQSVLSEADLLQLQKQLLNLEIQDLDSAYTCNVADLPEFTLTFKSKRQMKKVIAVCELPITLQDYIAFLDKMRISYMPAQNFREVTEEMN